MDTYVYWFLVALLLVILELATGTFYLLVVAGALAIGGVAALLSPASSLPFVLSAAASIFGTLTLYMKRRRLRGAMTELNLDIGQPVHEVVWKEDGTARAVYRGTEWDAEAESSGTLHAGICYIKAMRGSILILTHEKPTP